MPRNLLRQLEQIRGTNTFFDDMYTQYSEQAGRYYDAGTLTLTSGSPTVSTSAAFVNNEIGNFIIIDGTGVYQIATISGVTATVTPTPITSGAGVSYRRHYYKNIEDDLNYIRKQLDAIVGGTNWYDAPGSNLATLSGHGHTASDVSDFNEVAQDAVGNIMSGLGTVTVTYDDGGNVITISGASEGAGTDHSTLTNLDYDSAGHTGFVSTAVLTTVSGDLSSEIDSDISTHEAGTSHDSRYYTETEIDATLTTISGDLQTNIDGKSDTGHGHTASDTSDFDEAAQDAVGNIMSGAGSVTVTYDDTGNTITVSGVDTGETDHANLSNLDYANAGHTGFASTAVLTTTSGDLQTQLDSHNAIAHDHYDVDFIFHNNNIWKYDGSFSGVPSELIMFVNGVKNRPGDIDYYTTTISGGILYVTFDYGVDTDNWVNGAYTVAV